MKITKEDLERLNFAIMEVNKVYGELFAKLTLDEMERNRLRQQFYVASSNDNPDKTSDRAEFHLAFPPLALPSPTESETQKEEVKDGIEGDSMQKLKYGQGSISKRSIKSKNGKEYEYYVGRVYDSETKTQKTVSANTQKECLSRIAQLRAQISKQNHEIKTEQEQLKFTLSAQTPPAEPPKTIIVEEVQQSSDEMTFGAWLWKWYDTYKVPFLKPSSLSSIRVCINKHIPCWLKMLPLPKVTGLNLQEALNGVEFERQKDIVYDIFKCSLKQAHALELIKGLPFLALVHKRHKFKKSNILTHEDELKLLAVLSPIMQKIVKGYLWTGCRRCELLALTWKDVDYEKKRIFVHGTKTENAERYIPLFKGFIDAVGTPGNPDEKIFNLTVGRVEKNFAAAVDELNLGYITLHSLRHTFATRMYNEYKLDIKQLQTILGHSSSKTTADIYVHNSEDFEKMIAELVDD